MENDASTTGGLASMEMEDDGDSEIDPRIIDLALIDVIMKQGSQCLSQASLRTGFGIAALTHAKDRLVQRRLIRVRLGSEHRDMPQVSYELEL